MTQLTFERLRDAVADEAVAFAARILGDAAMHARAAGVGWEADEIRLLPAPRLLELIRRSRKVSATEPTAG